MIFSLALWLDYWFMFGFQFINLRSRILMFLFSIRAFLLLYYGSLTEQLDEVFLRKLNLKKGLNLFGFGFFLEKWGLVFLISASFVENIPGYFVFMLVRKLQER